MTLMCYPKPGPRCSAHAAKKKVEADLRLSHVRKGSFEDYLKAKEDLAEAEKEYDATPAGQRLLERRISNGEDRNGEYADRLKRGQLLREAQKEALQQARGSLPDEVPHQQVTFETFGDRDFYGPDEVRPARHMDGAPKNAHAPALINESDAWMSKLNTNEQEALAWYTSNGFVYMNAHLRGQEPDASLAPHTYEPEVIENNARHLKTAFDKAPLSEERVVHRGIKLAYIPGAAAFENSRFSEEGRADLLNHIQDQYRPGTVLSSPHPQSASVLPSVGSGFGEGVVMEVKTRKAHSVATLSAWGYNEGEVLISPDVKYRVVSVEEGQYSGRTDSVLHNVVIKVEEV